MYKVLSNSLSLAKEYLAKVIVEGSKVVDATAGNGKDTLFLARSVGSTGKVFAFDVQQQALDNSFKLIKDNGLEERVEFIHDCHANMDKYILGTIDAVMFNLGYLPGGNPAVITEAGTTCIAVSKALSYLRPGGLMTIVVYPGHAGGSTEAEAVIDLTTKLDQKKYAVAKIDFPNRVNNSPFLVLIEKQEEF